MFVFRVRTQRAQEEYNDKNTRTVKVQISSFMYDIVYAGTVLLSWDLSNKPVYQATLLLPERLFQIRMTTTLVIPRRKISCKILAWFC